MTLTVRLVPRLGDPHFEQLHEGISERPILVFGSDGQEKEMIVGRGLRSGIVDCRVCRKALRLHFDEKCFEENQVIASVCEHGKGAGICVNSLPWNRDIPSLHLSHGDVISLLGLNYEYTVKIDVEHGGKRKANEISPISECARTKEEEDGEDSTSERSGILIPQACSRRIADEINCSVCLEIQVYPRTLNPCGHSFCCACVRSLKECPQCRQRVHSHAPAVQLESLISTLVSIPTLLDKDDVEHFHERQASRTKEVNPDSASKKRCLRPRTRSQMRNPYLHTAAPRVQVPTPAASLPRADRTRSHQMDGPSLRSGRRRRHHTAQQVGGYITAAPQPFQGDQLQHEAFQPPTTHQTQLSTAGRTVEEAIVID